MVSAKESPVHANWKDAILAAKETDTVLLNRLHSPVLRALRTPKTHELVLHPEVDARRQFGTVLEFTWVVI